MLPKGDWNMMKLFSDLNAERGDIGQPNRVERSNRAGLELWNSSEVGKSRITLSGASRDPRQGSPYLGPRV